MAFDPGAGPAPDRTVGDWSGVIPPLSLLKVSFPLVGVPMVRAAFRFIALVGFGVLVAAGIPWSARAASIDKFIVAPEPMPAPTIAFTDAGGRTLGLADFKGKVLLVNFWATWCAPCVEEMPSLAKLQKSLGSNDFEVLAISIDRGGIGVTKPFLEKVDAAALGVYVDTSGKAPSAFKTPGLPTSVIIDREGRVRGKLLGAADWSSDAAQDLVRRYIDEPRDAGSGSIAGPKPLQP
jgi:thiol-disulfide isomerase/thioredoxin